MVVAALAVPVGAVLGVASTSALAVNVATAILWAGTAAASLLIQSTQQVKQDVGTKLRAASGGAVPLSGIFGEKETAGSLIYANTWGRSGGKASNSFLVRVYCLSDLEVSGLITSPGDSHHSPIWLSGDYAQLDLDNQGYMESDTATSGTSMGYVIPSKNHDGHEYIWVKFLFGDQVAADPYLRAAFPSGSRAWKSTMIGRGRALMIVTQRYTVKEANEAFEVAASLRGTKLYDWRKDSTNGGSGTQRWTDQTTWAYSGNPAVILYNIMRGIYRSGVHLYGGHNWPARRFDNATWTAVANTCDEDVTLANARPGGVTTVKRYRMGAEINFSDPPVNVVDRCLATFAGRLVESGGVYKLASGTVGAAVYAFSDDDIVISENLTATVFPSREEIVNTITGSYCEPMNGGEMKSYRKRSKVEYVTADGGEIRGTSMDFPYVRENTQAQRLAMIGLNDNRRFAGKVICLPPSARKLEPNDCLNWTASARFGYSNKKWILGDTTLTQNGWVIGVLREADPTDADWNPGNEDAYTVGVYGDIVPAQQIFTANVSAIVLKDASDNSRRPGIQISKTLDADDLVDARALAFRVRLKGTTEVIVRNRDDDFFDDTGSSQIRFSDAALIGGQTYQVATRIIPYSDRDTGWSAWGDGEVTLGLIGISGADLTPGSVDTGALADESVTTPKIDRKAISGSAKAAIRRQGANPPNYLFTKNSSGGETKTLMTMNIDNQTGAIVSLNYTFLNVTAQWTRSAIGPGPQYAPASCTITLTILRQNMPNGKPVKIASFAVDATDGYKSKVPNVASKAKSFKGALKIGSSFHGTQKVTLQAVVKGKTNSTIKASVWSGTMECSWQKR